MFVCIAEPYRCRPQGKFPAYWVPGVQELPCFTRKILHILRLLHTTYSAEHLLLEYSLRTLHYSRGNLRLIRRFPPLHLFLR